MTRWIVSLLSFAALLGLAAGAAAASGRVALVVGNAAYGLGGRLQTPVEDARSMARLLRGAGFDEVVLSIDATGAELRGAVRSFARLTAGADVALVYFAGRGLDIQGRSYLLPVDARLERMGDAELEALSLEAVLEQLSGASRLQLVVLDTCRQRVFLMSERRVHSIGCSGSGVPIRPGSKMLVAFASSDAGAVHVAPDGVHSLYGASLTRHLGAAGVDIRTVLDRVRGEVLRQSGGRQVPYVYGSLGPDVVALHAAGQRAGAPASLSDLAAKQPAKQYRMRDLLGPMYRAPDTAEARANDGKSAGDVATQAPAQVPAQAQAQVPIQTTSSRGQSEANVQAQPAARQQLKPAGTPASGATAPATVAGDAADADAERRRRERELLGSASERSRAAEAASLARLMEMHRRQAEQTGRQDVPRRPGAAGAGATPDPKAQLALLREAESRRESEARRRREAEEKERSRAEAVRREKERARAAEEAASPNRGLMDKWLDTYNREQARKKREELEAERRRKEQAEQARTAAEAEAVRRRKEAEAKRAAAAEAQKQAETRRQRDAEEQARRKAEEAERQRLAALAEANKMAEAKRAAEAEAQKQAELRRQRAAEEQARRKAEEAERLRLAALAEANKKAEAKRAAEAEAQKQAELRRQRAAEEQARRKAEEAERLRQARLAEEERARKAEAERKRLASLVEARQRAEEAAQREAETGRAGEAAGERQAAAAAAAIAEIERAAAQQRRLEEERRRQLAERLDAERRAAESGRSTEARVERVAAVEAATLLQAERQQAERRRIEAEAARRAAEERARRAAAEAAERQRQAAADAERQRQAAAEAERVASLADKLEQQRQAEVRARLALFKKCAASEVRPSNNKALRAIEAKFAPEVKKMVEVGLIRQGLLAGQASGTFGPATRTAIRQFQQRLGARQTGYLSACELQSLLVP